MMATASMDRGFEIIDGVYTQFECERLLDALEKSSRPGKRAGIRHLMSNDAVRDVANDERLLKIARNYVGDNAVPYRATLFEKSGTANWLVVWHQDTALPLTRYFESSGWGPWSKKEGINYAHAPAVALGKVIALRINLDASTEMNGPLRIIPGSHLLGVLDDTLIFEIARQSDAENCLTSVGGVIAMRPLLIHASSKAKTDSPRRVLHIEYAESLDISNDAKLAIA